MAYEEEESPEPMQEAEKSTFALPPHFSGEPGDIVKLKIVGRNADGHLEAEKLEEESDVEDEDLPTTLRRDMAALPNGGM